jgi:hypothetical protein
MDLTGLSPLRSLRLASLIPVLRLVLGVAVPAINRPALSRLERDLGLASAIGAFYIVHLAWPIIPGAPVAAPSVVSVHY